MTNNFEQYKKYIEEGFKIDILQEKDKYYEIISKKANELQSWDELLQKNIF